MSRPGELEKRIDAAIHTPEEISMAMKHLSALMKKYRAEHPELCMANVEADRRYWEARELLARSLQMLYLLGYDSSFTNPAIDKLTTDIKNFLEETA